MGAWCAMIDLAGPSTTLLVLGILVLSLHRLGCGQLTATVIALGCTAALSSYRQRNVVASLGLLRQGDGLDNGSLVPQLLRTGAPFC